MLKKLLLAACLVLVSVPAQAAFYFTDLACETTTTTGQGTLSLGGAQTNYLSFATAGVSTGDTVPYQITSADGLFETGIGTYTSGTPNTLARTTVKYSSSGAATKLTLIAGTHVVCIGPIASLWTGGNSWTMDLSTTGVAKLGTIELGHATDTTLSRLAASRAGVEGAPIGLYTFASSAPSSPQAGDVWVDSTTGIKYTYINDGDTSQWVQTGTSTATSDWTLGPQEPRNLGLSVTAGSSALTIALKGANGSDPSGTNPVYIPFSDISTATSGVPTWAQITSATSLVISSGSTMGVTSSQGFRIWIEGCNDAGTFRLGAFNASTWTSPGTTATIYPLADENTQSSTAEGGAGAADSAGVLYTGTAITSKQCRILGYAEWTSSGLTAGTWTTTNLARVQLFGPGVHKPGDAIQQTVVASTTDYSSATASFKYASNSMAITVVSAANIIKVRAVCRLDTVAAARAILVKWSRGTTDNTNILGFGANDFYGPGAQIRGGQEVLAFDKPNATGSTTYGLQVDATLSASVTLAGSTQPCSMEAWELMG